MRNFRNIKTRKWIVGFAGLILLMPAFLIGQAPLAFEVASIKPAEPITPAKVAGGNLRVGMAVDGARVDIGYLSLAELIPMAFDVKPYQVSGPDWMRSQRFDILAKMPEGATKENVPALLRALLEERFQLKVHRENRDNPIYALLVGKDGPKLKEAEPEPEVPAPDDAAGGKAGTPGNQLRVNAGRGGATMVSAQTGTTKITPGTDGMRLEMGRLNMSGLSVMLTTMLDRPVVDMTDLKGFYQVAIELPIDALLGMAKAAGVVPPGLGQRGEPGRPAEASDPSGGALFSSIQQLGLKLEARRAPVEFVVIDRLEKMPTEN